MITPRTTRLVRAADLRTFRRALAALATGGSPLDARDRLVIVPTRAAALHLQRSIEDGMRDGGAALLPDFITRAELHQRLFDRLATAMPYTPAEREALLTVACRTAIAAGAEPPFRVRPGLIAAMLDFFDTVKRHRKSVEDFERLTMGQLDGGEDQDRGAQRLVRQTRFFAAAFREFERLCAASGGVDEHAMYSRVLAAPAGRPCRHLVVAVGDRAGDRYGLYPLDWDLLARIPGLDRLDVVVTDTALAGAFHERIHQCLPGIEEMRFESEPAVAPTLSVPSADISVYGARDREEEVAAFSRMIRADALDRDASRLDRIAMVVNHRLPYVYVAREVLRAEGVPSQMFDALPLASEPYAAAVDLLFSSVSSNCARGPSVALLSSPHFAMMTRDAESIRDSDIAALDRGLSEAGYLGGVDALRRLVASWQTDATRVSTAAVRAALVLQALADEIEPLWSDATIADHLDHLLAFLVAHEKVPGANDPLRARQLRARGAILGLIRGLRNAYRRFDTTVVPFDQAAAMIRRAIDAHTFAPRTGESGVHVVDADSAPFGEFERVHLAGLVDGEWPDRPRRNIFYSPGILRELGWPADAERVEGVRASFADLLRLPAKELVLSTFSLEHDSIVAPSMLLDEIVRAGLEVRVRAVPGRDDGVVLSSAARVWAAHRVEHPPLRPAGRTCGHRAKAYSISALERYQDCPFKFFATDVLHLDELPEDEASLSPRARGRFIHEVFQRFFEAWDGRGGTSITSATVDAARAVFADVAEPLLDALPDADAALERTRLFGSPITVGMVDVVLDLEAERPVDVSERLLEHRLDGAFTLGSQNERAVPLRGIADRIDLLAGNRLRVIDYKSGYAPQPKRALQVPIYALCAQERLSANRGGSWTVDGAAYVAFSGKRTFVPIIKAGKDNEAVLADARTRLLAIVDGIESGEFPPRPYEPRICSYCAYPSVCRKDYVGDE